MQCIQDFSARKSSKSQIRSRETVYKEVMHTYIRVVFLIGNAGILLHIHLYNVGPYMHSPILDESTYTRHDSYI